MKLIFLAFVVMSCFPWTLPQSGTYQVGEPIRIETTLICATIDVEPDRGAHHVIADDDPHVAYLVMDEPGPVSRVELRCGDVRGVWHTYPDWVDWQVTK